MMREREIPETWALNQQLLSASDAVWKYCGKMHRCIMHNLAGLATDIS